MSTDKVNTFQQLRKDITWELLVTESQKSVKTHQETIEILHKSIVFFNKQIEYGVPIPSVGEYSSKRQDDLS